MNTEKNILVFFFVPRYSPKSSLDFGGDFSDFLGFSMALAAALALGSGFDLGCAFLLAPFATFVDSDSELFSGEKILFFLASLFFIGVLGCRDLGGSLPFTGAILAPALATGLALALTFAVGVAVDLGVIVALLLGLILLFRVIGCFLKSSSSSELYTDLEILLEVLTCAALALTAAFLFSIAFTIQLDLESILFL